MVNVERCDAHRAIRRRVRLHHGLRDGMRFGDDDASIPREHDDETHVA